MIVCTWQCHGLGWSHAGVQSERRGRRVKCVTAVERATYLVTYTHTHTHTHTHTRAHTHAPTHTHTQTHRHTHTRTHTHTHTHTHKSPPTPPHAHTHTHTRYCNWLNICFKWLQREREGVNTGVPAWVLAEVDVRQWVLLTQEVPPAPVSRRQEVTHL